MASPLKRARGNERVEDGSWHNDEEETNAAGCGGGEKIPARERARKEGGRQSHGLSREGMLREDKREGEGSTDQIASSGCIEGGRER